MGALSYERSPGTLVLIDRPYQDPNPFDARRNRRRSRAGRRTS
ncbi:hypothetical protein ACU686_40910 [Yinghuangia aomiensis]